MQPGIVLLHGQPDLSVSLWPLRAALHGRLGPEVPILVPDRPGYGANPLPSTDFAGNVRWLQDRLRQAGIGPVLLVGHSWAGAIALLSAARRGGSIVGVVTLASIGPGCVLPVDLWLGRRGSGEALSYLSLQAGRRILLRRPIEALRHGLSPSDRTYGRVNVIAMTRRPVWRSFLAEQRVLLQQLPMINAALGDVNVPTMVLQGSADTVIPAETATALAARVPQATLTWIAGAGHDLHLRRAGELAELIAGFARPLLGAQFAR